jgi:hypothetical protein
LMVQEQVIASRVYPKRWFSVDTMEHLTELAKYSLGLDAV